MGCVSFTKRFFADGKITQKQFKKAVSAAQQELLNIKAQYKKLGWKSEIGSSGTIRAVEQAIISNGWGNEGITPDGLEKLVDHCLDYETVDDVDIEGVKPDRRQVFIGGLAILTAVFQTLDIKHMRYSDGALREGALWDLVGRSEHEDVVAALSPPCRSALCRHRRLTALKHKACPVQSDTRIGARKLPNG